ncbi:hypothetical protein KFK09_006202 [Dendrobium nobile]|uniref:Uncharacterized protein n=1 Tax=Dendrobium nobile TaxID=94219 RepID=A0A8T3BRC9_DENNO|nr:hypothetical protein KFK09_006202 [Dendrobium nobile]
MTAHCFKYFTHYRTEQSPFPCTLFPHLILIYSFIAFSIEYECRIDYSFFMAAALETHVEMSVLQYSFISYIFRS